MARSVICERLDQSLNPMFGAGSSSLASSNTGLLPAVGVSRDGRKVQLHVKPVALNCLGASDRGARRLYRSSASTITGNKTGNKLSETEASSENANPINPGH